MYKLKCKADGSVDRHKAWLVAKGCAQKQGIDFEETFAPTSSITTIQCVIAIAAHMGREVHPLDIKIAFLCDLLEEVYVSQPLGFEVLLKYACYAMPFLV